MFLVDHDQADVVKRCEYGRAGADANPGLPPGQPQPLVVPFPGAHPRVHHGDDVSEASREPGQRLWGQRDLRHQDDHRSALVERGLCAAWR